MTTDNTMHNNNEDNSDGQPAQIPIIDVVDADDDDDGQIPHHAFAADANYNNTANNININNNPSGVPAQGVQASHIPGYDNNNARLVLDDTETNATVPTLDVSAAAASRPSTPITAAVPGSGGNASSSLPQGILLNVPNSPHSHGNRARSGSDSGSIHFTTLHTPGRAPSPSPSRTVYGDDAASSLYPPPSPTLSAVSSASDLPPGATTLVLRDNQPTATSGLSSLQLLHPNGHGGANHMRKPSAGTITTIAASDDGKLDPGSPTSAFQSHSSRTSMTIADVTRGDGDIVDSPTSTFKQIGKDGQGSTKGGVRRGSKESADEHNEDGASKKIPLEEEEEQSDVDMGPFPHLFQPKRLAALVDPKSIDELEKLGGIEGVLKGLGTDPKLGLCGLGKDLGHAHGSIEIDGNEPGHHLHPLPKRSLSGTVNDHGGGGGGGGGGDPYSASLDLRRRLFGVNALPARPSKSLLQLMWLAFKDKVLLMLTVAAVVSLALGLFQDFGTTRPTFSCGNGQACTEPPVDWVEGVAIMVAVVIVVGVGSLNDWQKEKQFRKLNDKKEDRTVKVIRDGSEKVINVKDVVVGDVALLEPGEIVPCDGVFIGGHNIKCDESGMTGESDVIKKLSPADCENTRAGHTDCFIVSGSKVIEGVGSYVVIAVGKRSFSGRITMALRTEDQNTPMQAKLNHLAEMIAKVGLTAGILLFVALFIRFCVQLGTGNPQRSANEKGLAFVQILIIAVTLVVVAVPEGLPLAVTLALAFATKRMTAENLLVRVLSSCETMANASVVCTDKTGTLTQNEMTVVAGSVGIHAKFVQHLKENQARTNAGDARERGAPETNEERERRRKHPNDFSLDQAQLGEVLSPALRRLFNEAIAINSTAFEDTDPQTGEVKFVGSKTETALLKFAKELGWPAYHATREAAEIVQMVPFSSERKAMGVVVKLRDGRWRFYLKGASEILTKKCTRHVVVSRPGEVKEGSEDAEVETRALDEQASDNISRTIIFYANQTLRTIALCYRDLDQWPPAGCQRSSADGEGSDEDEDSDEVPYEALARDLTLIGITGIEDPLRPGVREAVAACTRAGVQVKMCTGDNVLTARSIALQCGIFTPGGLIMEGPAFRGLKPSERFEVVPRLQVLARSSPEDKRLLVETLRGKNGSPFDEIVGVTGDGTNDGPALKAAHVGFSMGIAGTETAKEASDIILMDDNFASIVKAIMWGRCVNDAVRKFLQFQISTNVTAVIITFVTAVASASEESALTAVQLLWINIIMDTFAALALATDPASTMLLERKPDKADAPLFNVHMYKQIIGQSFYQTVIILVFHFAGNAIFGYVPDPNDQSVQKTNDTKLATLVFNAFVFAQIFNSVNCRRIDGGKNVFAGMTRNWYFMVITLLEIGVQVLIVFVGGSAFQVTKINGRDWGISLALGLVSLPLGFLLRCLPNAPFERVLIWLRLLPDPNALPTTEPRNQLVEAERELPMPLGLLRDSLQTFSSVRGGRARASSFVSKSRAAMGVGKAKFATSDSASSTSPLAPDTSLKRTGSKGSAKSGEEAAAQTTPPPPKRRKSMRRRDSTASRRGRDAAGGSGAQSLMVMVPSMMAGTIGAVNWTPSGAGTSTYGQGQTLGAGLDDPAASDPSRSSAALWEGKVQLHPETDPEDPAYKKWGFSLAKGDGEGNGLKVDGMGARVGAAARERKGEPERVLSDPSQNV